MTICKRVSTRTCVEVNTIAVAMAEPPWWEGSLFPVTEEEAILGVMFIDCPGCGGVGLIPWDPEDIIDDCVLCKGSGRYPVGL